MASAVAHYITGVLDRNSMISMAKSLCVAANFQPGDKVRILKGSLRGIVLAILDDGRLKWRAESGTEFFALPESLIRDHPA